MRKLSVILSAAAAVGILGITATPAHAILNVTCLDGADYTEFHNEKRHCFAYAGYMDVYITNVYKIVSNNNNITVRATYSGGSRTFDMGKWQTLQWNTIRYTIEDVTIH